MRKVNFSFKISYFEFSNLSYDGSIFHTHAVSENGHYATTLANVEGSPLAVGGSDPETNKAETYDISTNTWTQIADYPYHSKLVLLGHPIVLKIYYRIYLFATVTTEQGALIIGGYDGSDVATVACYNKAGWSRLEDLHYT